MSKRPFFRSRETIRRLSEDRKGAILPLFGIMVILMVIIAGAAVDISRVVNAREKLSYALDAAGLALAVELSTTVLKDSEVEEILSDSFKANLANADFLDEAIENLEYTIDSDAGTVTVTSSATLNNYFLGMGGYSIENIGPEFFEFGTSAQVSYSTYDVELALVLDVTGSMSSEMDSLISAADSVLNILIPEGTAASDSKVKISLIPYSQGVNLGTYASTVTDGSSSSDNCVNEREGDKKYTDDTYNYDGSDSEYFHGTPDYLVYDYEGSESWYSGYDGCPDNELIPLSAERSTLETAIEDLTDGGGTGGQVGIAWGWYTLSPNWTNLWPSDSDPEAYDDDEVKKLALIMTDGDFNMEYGTEERTTCSGKGKSKTCSTNEYWVERYHYYSDYTDPPAERAKSLCDAMKAENIEIFAVFFDTGGSDFGDDLMEYCSSGDDYYYEASSSTDLINAFSNIAKKIQEIHLSK